MTITVVGTLGLDCAPYGRRRVLHSQHMEMSTIQVNFPSGNSLG